MIRSDGINTGETRVYHILKYVVVFSAAGLFGPVIRFMIWSPSALMKEARIIYGFIYDLLFLLWPMQALAVMEVSIGRTKAARFGYQRKCSAIWNYWVVDRSSRTTPRPYHLYLRSTVLTGCMVGIMGRGFQLDPF